MAKKFLPTRQNGKEKEILAILNNVCPGIFKFTGNGKVSVGGYDPDFISDTKNLIIEFLGCYWHNCVPCGYGSKNAQAKENQDLKIRAAMYGANGYKSLFIWEHELSSERKLVERIRSFVYGKL